MAQFWKTVKAEAPHALWLFAVTFGAQVGLIGTNNYNWKAVVSAAAVAARVVWSWISTLNTTAKAAKAPKIVAEG